MGPQRKEQDGRIAALRALRDQRDAYVRGDHPDVGSAGHVARWAGTVAAYDRLLRELAVGAAIDVPPFDARRGWTAETRSVAEGRLRAAGVPL